MSETILVIGLTVFFAHFLSLQFRKTNIPDVLMLMLLGIIIGPVFGIVTPDDFGKIGSLIATIALVVILFESGTSLDLDTLSKLLTTTGFLTFWCFVLTTLIVIVIGIYALDLGVMPATILGVILGGTSPAVVIPLVHALKLSQQSATVLVLESALADVFSIVGVFALLQVHVQGDLEPGKIVGGVLAALIFAAIIGVLGGIGWMLVLGKIRDFPDTISSTLAFLFILYGIAEMLGFSGAIAALTLGITLTNYEKLGLRRIQQLDRKIEPLSETDLSFYRESVFLLKTYFFVYLGISIRFGHASIAITAAVMVVLIFVMRLGLSRMVFRAPSYSLRDSAFASMMGPKGLASAVLAALPLQFHVEGGEVIRDTTYMVVLISITLSAVLVMAYQAPLVQRVYALILGKPRADKTTLTET